MRQLCVATLRRTPRGTLADRRGISSVIDPLISVLDVAASPAEPLCGSSAAAFLTVAPGVCVQGVFLAPLAAMKHFRDTGTTADVAIAPYTAMFANGSLWATYGALQENAAIMMPNLPAIVLGAGYCGYFIKHRSPQAVVLPYLGASAAMVGTTVGAACVLPSADAASFIGTLGCAVSVAMFSGPLASIKAVLRDRSAASIPPAFTVLSLVNCSVWTAYGGLVIHDPFIWAPNMLGFSSAAAQAGLIAKFGAGPSGLPRSTSPSGREALAEEERARREK